MYFNRVATTDAECSKTPTKAGLLRKVSKRLATTSMATCAILMAQGAFAQTKEEDPTLIGVGLRARPAYEGADANRVDLIPVLRIYRGPWFARTTQGKLEGGGRIALARGLVLGGQIAYEGGRVADESAFLKSNRVPDLDPSLSVGVHIEYDTKIGIAPLTALARIRQHLESDRGAEADFRVTIGVLDKGGFNAGAFGQLTVSDGSEMRGYYGVSPALAANSGLAVYQPGAGARFIAGGVLGSYDLGRRWLLVGSAELRRMIGEAASSPLVRDKNNAYLSIGVAYKL